jgi:15-cis-phytoene synthase
MSTELHLPSSSPLDRSTFAPGARLLPDSVRGDVARLYGVLRTLDDLVDEGRAQAPARLAAAEAWARGESADSPESRVLDELAGAHGFPREALLEFCAGMREDLANVPIKTEADLETYCQRAGGSVGVMLGRILGTNSSEGEAKLATLGRAMQRTNILRDIDEDLARGRTYIAAETIARFGPLTAGERCELVRDQIARADALYEEGLAAIPLLRRGGRGLALSVALYREILRQLEREGFGTRPNRPATAAWRRRLIVARHHLHAA